jgi:type IV secretory pathway VirB9-like protein
MMITNVVRFWICGLAAVPTLALLCATSEAATVAVPPSPTLNCSPESLCDVELAPGEVLRGTAIADPTWNFNRLASGSPSAEIVHVLVWPNAWNTPTTLFVTSDRSKYLIHLTADKAQPLTPTLSLQPPKSPVRFSQDAGTPLVSASAVSATAALDPSSLHFAYRLPHGRYAPDIVFDDSTHTYIAWTGRKPPEAPAVLGIDESGEPALLSPHVFLDGSLYVIDAVVPKLELRVGKKTLTILNEGRVK